jgi:quercetin dioxygenase-like cupin family protein
MTHRIGDVRYGPGGGVYHIVGTAAQTGNTHFGFEAPEPPGGGPPLHIQTREEELFVVLEGQITFWLDGQVIKRSAGGTAFVPRGMPHCFKNCSDRARVDLVHARGHPRVFRLRQTAREWRSALGRDAHRKDRRAGSGLRNRDAGPSPLP